MVALLDIGRVDGSAVFVNQAWVPPRFSQYMAHVSARDKRACLVLGGHLLITTLKAVQPAELLPEEEMEARRALSDLAVVARKVYPREYTSDATGTRE